MTDDIAIDKMYAELLRVASNSEYGFVGLRGYWGIKSSENYQMKLLQMMKNTRRLARECSILYGEGKFWLFDTKIYVPVREELVERSFRLVTEYFEIIESVKQKIFATEFIKTIRYYNPMRRSNNLVAFNNGILNLGGMLKGVEPTFYPVHGPQYHVTYYHPYDYDPKAKCLMWQNFLHEVLPDKNARVILQMFLGLGLIDAADAYNPCEGKESPKVELCLILIGNGANGKSVIYKTAQGIFGKERISGVDYDELTSGGDEGMRARRLLREAVFNWSSDSDGRTFGRKRSGVFKRIVSGETVTDRAIGENVSQNDNMPYLVFSLNELPYPDDQSLGFIRRLQFISFDVVIPKDRQNKTLARDLVRNYPGIFNWILRGTQEIIRRKFIFPSSDGSRRAMLLTQLRVSPVLAWATAYGARGTAEAKGEIGVYISQSVIRKSLDMFCEDNEAPEIPSDTKVGRELASMGFYKRRHKGDTEYLVYGCTDERLGMRFIIRNESLTARFQMDDETFIKEDD